MSKSKYSRIEHGDPHLRVADYEAIMTALEEQPGDYLPNSSVDPQLVSIVEQLTQLGEEDMVRLRCFIHCLVEIQQQGDQRAGHGVATLTGL